ncbi:MAG: lipoprotein-releasing ABC transporter permease subunit [Desulfobacterales bacterium]|jgi:lipoprotein-releasing system permease protein|nr:lipoprotein-releasing system transmembrane subunit LolC [Desulfobacter sp.]MDP6395832.1 lipoprotein-releasing ABC transporter permease subunit [Desulfobacterales bacterium]MDP6681434.1 lipoprotein-releasing ABC transporter permease subunit [Desulfobacterales bacterium]MDP6806576.1 lipoprotein-releasing ABC transporter permease subunit [Desulfobacterales bacterium]|tara:strand:- start:36523 stop:37761 length:1239 start_codon:yes stop_codon:yes gene_type:complete
MSFEYFIGLRYLRAKQKHAFISLITILSIAGVTVGVMALIVVIAVISGFESDLKSRILGGQSHVVLMRYGGTLSDYRRVIKDVEKTPGVEAATPFIYTQIMLRSSSGISGAVLRGVDPESAGRVIKSLERISFKDGSNVSQGQKKKIALPGIILGKELAKNIGVSKGDMVFLISPRGTLSPIGHIPAMRRFMVTGFFESGMYEFDGSFAYINIVDAQKMLHMGDTVTGIEVRVKDIYQAKSISERIVKQLGFPFWTKDWMQMNKNLFSALKLEKTVMFVILTLIVLVAAFNIASTLIMMVMGKKKDIAILKAMGATDKSIRKIFVFKGMVIGTIGTILGMCLGFILCTLLKYYNIIELTGDIYYFTTTLPVKLEMLDVFLIVAATMVVCFFATLYPARQASKFQPVEAIRFG